MPMENPPALPSLDVWTSALLTKSGAGRGGNGKVEAYGIKKLRELILELAVRGKLVAQDSRDEPASELLKKTIAEKKRLIAEGVIREAKAPALPAELPDHELPAGWVWTNLFEIGAIAPRNDSVDTTEASFVPMQAISERYGAPVEHEVKPWGEIKSGFTHFREEDVVLAKITPCFQNGKSAVMRGLTNGFGAGTTELHVYRSINACTVPEYVLVYLKSPRFIGDGIPRMTGTAGQKRITRDYFAGNRFPLPPLAEQHRIVAKVDELMALCDQLEQQQTNSLAAHQTLVETLLGTLTRVESQQEFSAAWARIANHFDTLFTTEASIDQLKQTLLQLAVMGKLVPQDANDEPASELLKKIAAEKAKLVKACKVKNEKLLPPIPEEERPFEVPQSWEWIWLSDLLPEFQNGVSSRGDKDGKPITVLRLADIKNRRISLDDTRTIPINSRDIEKYQLLTGDILITRVNGSADIVGSFVLYDARTEAIYCDHFIRMRIAAQWMNANYLCLLGESSLFRKNIQNLFITTAGQKTVNQGHIGSLPIALPPLAEQRRIVAKVDELMALCDALKARIKDAQTTQLHLADAIVEQAVC